MFHRVDVPLVKLKKNSVRCHLFPKKSGLQSLQISSTFKFSFIFSLLPYGETFLTGNYMFKVNNRNTRTRCEICSKLTINKPDQRHWRRSGVFIINFEHVSHFVLVFILAAEA